MMGEEFNREEKIPLQTENGYLSRIDIKVNQNVSIKKSPEIFVAIRIMYSILLIGVIRYVLEYRISTSLSLKEPVSIAVFLLLLGILVFLVYRISKGSNIARISYLTVFLVFLPFYLWQIVFDLSFIPYSGMLGVSQIILYAVSFVILFRKESSEFFKAR